MHIPPRLKNPSRTIPPATMTYCFKQHMYPYLGIVVQPRSHPTGRVRMNEQAKRDCLITKPGLCLVSQSPRSERTFVSSLLPSGLCA
jgi:hypothetical protein